MTELSYENRPKGGCLSLVLRSMLLSYTALVLLYNMICRMRPDYFYLGSSSSAGSKCVFGVLQLYHRSEGTYHIIIHMYDGTGICVLTTTDGRQELLFLQMYV